MCISHLSWSGYDFDNLKSLLIAIVFHQTCSLCRVGLAAQFPARGSTQVLLCSCSGSLCLWLFLYSVFHIQCQAFKYICLLCQGHSWRVRLAKQETPTLSGQLVASLVSTGPWMSTVVLYCLCHNDSALSYFIFQFLSCEVLSGTCRVPTI